MGYDPARPGGNGADRRIDTYPIESARGKMPHPYCTRRLTPSGHSGVHQRALGYPYFAYKALSLPSNLSDPFHCGHASPSPDGDNPTRLAAFVSLTITSIRIKVNKEFRENLKFLLPCVFFFVTRGATSRSTPSFHHAALYQHCRRSFHAKPAFFSACACCLVFPVATTYWRPSLPC